MEENLLTVDDVAEILAVPRERLLYWRRTGKGPPAFKLGKAVRYRREELELWIERSRE